MKNEVLDKFLAALGEEGKKIRGNKSQYEIAEKADMRQSRIVSIEKGRVNLTIGKLLDYARGLGKKLEIRFR